MTITFNTIDGKNKIPAAIHQSDQTARAQILRKNQNPELWDLINKFFTWRLPIEPYPTTRIFCII